MFKYKITGQVTYEGETVEIEETVEVEDKSAFAAFEAFQNEFEQYDFFGNLKSCDAETGGKLGATYRDQNEDQTIDIDLVK